LGGGVPTYKGEGREWEKGRKGMGREREGGKDDLHPTLFLGPGGWGTFLTVPPNITHQCANLPIFNVGMIASLFLMISQQNSFVVLFYTVKMHDSGSF